MMVALILFVILFVTLLFIIPFQHVNMYYFILEFIIETNNITIIIGLGYNSTTVSEIKGMFRKKEVVDNDMNLLFSIIDSNVM